MTTPFKFSLMVALRYLWSKRSEAFITIITIISILGVAIGVMVLNMVMAIMTGFETELKEKVTSTNSHIVVRSLGGKLYGWEQIFAQIQKLEQVKSVSPLLQHQALIRTEDKSGGILIRAIQKGTSSAQQLAEYLEEGQSIESMFLPPSIPLTDAEGNQLNSVVPGIVIGRELARQFNLFLGDTVSVLTPQVASSPFGLVPRFRRFQITGIYNSGLVEYESGVAYISLQEGQKFFGYGPAITSIEIRVKDLDATTEISEELMSGLGALSKGLYVQDWKESNRALWDLSPAYP